jgi:hypothetical protein
VPVRTSATPRRAAGVGLTALVLSLSGGPALALDGPLPQLDTVTAPVESVVDPAVDTVAETLSPSPEPSPSPTPLLPLPEPVAELVDPVLDPVVEQVTGESAPAEPAPAPLPGAAAPTKPVTGQGAAPQPVTGPAGGAAGSSGVGSLGSLGEAPGLSAGTANSSVPRLGAPLLAAAPAFTLPGLPGPQTAPEPAADVWSARPLSDGAPAGLPALVVAVAAVAVAGAAAAHATELRRRRLVPVST